MNRIVRFFFRFIFHVCRFLLKIIESIAPRVYMNFYIHLLSFSGVKFLGRPKYISTKVKFDDFNLITISDRVVISDGVVLLTHDYSLTTGLISIEAKPKTDIAFLRPIFFDKNVFVGMNSLVLPGTHVAKNVVIGAGSVIRGNLQENSVFLGNPMVRIGNLTDMAEKWKRRIPSEKIRID